MRIVSHQTCHTLQDQAVLVVQVGIADVDGDIAFRQRALVHVLDTGANVAFFAFQQYGLEIHYLPQVPNTKSIWPDGIRPHSSL